MTAICAYWSRDGGTHATDRVNAMVAALTMYGRDRTGLWSDGAIAMAIHQRHTVAEDRFDAQPTLVHDTVLVADIRLDDRDALSRALGISAAHVAGMADSALLHAAWRAWGPACVHRLVGEFAFAIWNSTEQSLFCARDPIGARPLCYATAGQAVAVASMPKGVLALPDLPRRLDERRMAEYLALLPSDGARTFFDGVSSLPPGHTLHVTPDQIKIRAYWEPPQEGSVRFSSDDDYVEHFLELFDQAVAAQLRTLGPVAALVSGGFDSTSVTALAARQLVQRGEALHALTWIPRPGADAPVATSQLPDESQHAASLRTLYPNIRHELVDSADVCPLTSLPDFHTAWDQPVLNPIKVPMLCATTERLAALGCDVVLTGQGGNTTISYDGLTLLPTLLRHGRLLRAAQETMALARAPGWTARRAVSTVISPLLPAAVARWVRRIRGHPFEASIAHSAIHPEFAAAHNVASIAAQRGWSLHATSPSDSQQLRSQLTRRLDVSMATKGLLAIMGVDHRDPTWDIRLLTYCWAIPEDQFLRRGQTRWLFRRAMAGILPPGILSETRRGLQSADWPRFVAPYRAVYAEEIARIERSPLARTIIDVRILRRLMDCWPTTWTTAERFPYGMLLLRTIGAGQFIRQFEST